jgi:hypothetical protein
MANIRQLITTGTSSGKGEAIKSGSSVLNQAIALLNQVENRLGTAEGGLSVLVGVPGLIDDIYSQLELLEDQISLTVSSAEITKLTQSYDNEAVSQIAVEEIVIDLAPGDILKIANLEDLENPYTFEVSGSSVIAAGATTIPIQPVDGTGTVTITAASGAAVVLDGFSLLTKIQLLKDQIILKADQTSVDALTGDLEQLQSEIQILSDQISLVTQQGSAVELGVTAAAYSGTISSITLADPIPIDLPLGALLILDNPEKTEVYTTQIYLASNNVTVLAIATEGGGPVTLPDTLPAGSSVFLAGNLLLSKIQILADAITSTVRSFSQVNAICRLTSQINSGSPITSISVTPLLTPLEVGDQLLIYNKDNLDTLLVTVSTAKETTTVNTTILINSVTPSAVIPVDSGVHIREAYAFSKIKQTKDSVTTQVERFSLAGALATTTQTYNESRTTIAVSALPYDVKTGDRFYIINKTTGENIPIVLTQNANAGTTTLTISTTTINAPSGSGVHVDTALLRSTVTQTASSITSTVESLSTAGSFTTLTSSYSGAQTVLAVNALPSALVAGQKMYVINRTTGLTYPVVLAANATQNATLIQINSATVVATSGSGLHLDVSDYKSVITQTANAITFNASSLYGALLVGTTSQQYSPNQTTLFLGSGNELASIAVPSGSTLIVNAGTQRDLFFTFTTTTNTAVGASQISVSANNVTVPLGARVYLAPVLSSGRINILTDQINLSVSRTALRSYLNGSYVSYVISATSNQDNFVASLPLGIQLLKGDVIRFLPDPSLGQTEVTDPPIELIFDRTEPINSSQVRIFTTTTTSRNLTGMLINLERAGDVRIGSSLQIFADSIVTDTPILRSAGYSTGSSGWAIKGNGNAEFNNITGRGTLQSNGYSEGVSGWRINKEGSAEFNDVTVRGNFEAVATNNNYVRLFSANGEVLTYGASTNANTGGVHVLSNGTGATRFGLVLHENGFIEKQTVRKFTIYHNNESNGNNGGSLVFQYSSGTPSLKFWGVSDTTRNSVTAGTFEASGNSKFYGNYTKETSHTSEFKVTDALASSVIKVTSGTNQFTSNTNVTTLAGHILVDINGVLYKMPFYTY